MTDVERVRRAFAASAAAVAALRESEETLEGIASLARAVAHSLREGGTIWLFGNGGSAADAQHLAAELVGRFLHERRALPAVALTGNSSVLTAVANDYGFEQVFARQLEALGRPGDVALGISTSGRSANVVEGLRTAARAGLVTAALTGGDGGALREVAAECIVVPVSETPRIQECHALVVHVLCELVEEELS
jgi:D-sedoheptulose 7-phosphate isomerase